MRRRDMVAVLFAAGLGPGAARAQPSRKTIGVLFPGVLNAAGLGEQRLTLIRQGLGPWAARADVVVREALGDAGKLRPYARELADRGPDVILAIGSAALRAAADATRTIPVVGLDLETDPIRAGMVASLNHPGGNVTGIFLDAPQIAGKGLQFLKDVVPKVSTVGLLYDAHTDDAQMRAAEAAGRDLGLRPVPLPIEAPQSVSAVISTATAAGVGALLIHSSPLFVDVARAIADAALAAKLPTVGFLQVNARAGALLAYGPDNFALLTQSGELVARILDGAAPATLPIQQPTRFQLIVNIGTARALGLELPASLLLVADEVIE
jgi:putative ABC transport system substrate-binding protein